MVDTGTFSGAAGELGYTQSAVSQQVAGLERAVGAKLFDRPGGPSHVRLTPLGEVLVGHARAIVARLHAAAADVAAVRAGDKGTLRVGTMQSIGTKVLPRLLRRYREERPGIELLPQETWDHTELAAAVEDGRFDLSFAQLPMPEGPFAVRRVLDDPHVLLAPADAPEAGSDSVTLRAAARLPLIGYTRPHGVRGPALQPAPHRHRAELRLPLQRQPDDPGLRGLRPRLRAHAPPHRGRGRPRGVRRPVCHRPAPAQPRPPLARRPGSSAPSVEHFVELAAEVCAELSRDWTRADDRPVAGR